MYSLSGISYFLFSDSVIGFLTVAVNFGKFMERTNLRVESLDHTSVFLWEYLFFVIEFNSSKLFGTMFPNVIFGFTGSFVASIF